MSLVALKTMNAHDKGTRHQSIKELTAFAALDSPFVVSFLGAYLHKGGKHCD
jgi:hypothetical protein